MAQRRAWQMAPTRSPSSAAFIDAVRGRSPIPLRIGASWSILGRETLRCVRRRIAAGSLPMETFRCNGHASATGPVAAGPRWAAPNAEGIRAERVVRRSGPIPQAAPARRRPGSSRERSRSGRGGPIARRAGRRRSPGRSDSSPDMPPRHAPCSTSLTAHPGPRNDSPGRNRRGAAGMPLGGPNIVWKSSVIGPSVPVPPVRSVTRSRQIDPAGTFSDINFYFKIGPLRPRNLITADLCRRRHSRYLDGILRIPA